jgi:hypothetical protein
MTPPEDEDSDGPDILDKGEKLGGGGFPAPWARDSSKNDTAQRRDSIVSDQTYRIAVIGFWLAPDKLSGVLEAAYPKIFDGHHGPKIALHPGVAVAGSKLWPEDVNEVRNAARTNEVTALFEAKIGSERPAYKAVAPDGSMLPIEIYQRFATSGQANADLDMVAKLVEDCASGQQRTLNLAGLPLGLLVCGENNVLINPKSEGYRARVRYPRGAQIFERVKVVFNGTHYTMRNWGKMHQRFKYLSDGHRWAFYATNCNKKEWGLTTVRAYYNRRLIADSSGPRGKPPHGVPKPFLVVDEEQRYLALVFDIPGKLLV